MKMLAIDTSTYVLSVALSDDGTIVGEYTTNLKKNHSVRLMHAIDDLLQGTGTAAKELDAIAAAKGPGSYTGVRIGITTAKSLAWSLGIPVYGISTLHMYAQNGRGFAGMICPFIDARRDQVYTGLYESRGRYAEVVQKDRIILLEDWLEELKHVNAPVLFLSQDSDKHKASIVKALGTNAYFGDAREQLPHASAMFSIIQKEGGSIDPHHLVPEYAQLAEAEKKWLAAKEGVSHE
ncbi:tRNA (adenosine(37)-N6)-threonylcarbamoyltransferase complex dimerization subunit type 1 TsaB [Alteribacillus sp. HJP-4]|uniref:tRNA (adenosine(37)-N6)-threonylcarbamoyltransferase complex dimerization subunit type 1 TsaB n=1 Tax=Alteribacillus sp. HJP-4 TaxID=2775394 RepID=UPI0035CD37E0